MSEEMYEQLKAKLHDVVPDVELRIKAGKGHSSLEDTFLTLVAEQVEAA